MPRETLRNPPKPLSPNETNPSPKWAFAMLYLCIVKTRKRVLSFLGSCLINSRFVFC